MGEVFYLGDTLRRTRLSVPHTERAVPPTGSHQRRPSHDGVVVLLWVDAVNRVSAWEAGGSGRRKATSMYDDAELEHEAARTEDATSSVADPINPHSQDLDTTLIALVRVMARDAARTHFAAQQRARSGGSR